MRVPTRSDGTRSGVNCTRRNCPAEHLGQRLDGQRLGQAGHALEQHVAAGQQRDEQALEHRVLADDHPLELIQRVLEARARVLDDLGPVLVHHRLGVARRTRSG